MVLYNSFGNKVSELGVFYVYNFDELGWVCAILQQNLLIQMCGRFSFIISSKLKFKYVWLEYLYYSMSYLYVNYVSNLCEDWCTMWERNVQEMPNLDENANLP